MGNRFYLINITNLVHLFLILIFFSCSKTADQNINDAIESANNYLTSEDCDNAIKELTNIGHQSKNARYLIALASSYACKANYKTTTFYGKNLDKLAGTARGFLGSLTKFTTSMMTSPTDPTYTNLQLALDVLLYAGNVDTPTSQERASFFTKDELQDMNIFSLYLILTTLGKYLFYYGNADPTTGTKGAGAKANGNPNSFSNGCLFNYDLVDPTLQLGVDLALANGLGSCNTTATGSSKLFAFPNATTTTRMCQGVILFNQLLDILLNTEMPGSGKALVGLADTLEALCTSVPQLGDICNVKKLSECEENYATLPQTDQLQVYFFSVLEANF